MKNIRTAIFIIILSLCISSGVFAEKLRKIELIDGTVLMAEILSVKDNVYTLKTLSLGTLELKASHIKVIHLSESDAGTSSKRMTTASKTPPAKAPLQANDPNTATGKAAADKQAAGVDKQIIQNIQELMMGDQGIQELVLSLQTDPEIQKILTDPDIMNAVSSMDITTLLSNPAFIKLLQNSTVKTIVEKTAPKVQEKASE